MFASVWHVRFELFTLLDYEKSLGTDGTKTTDREKKRKRENSTSQTALSVVKMIVKWVLSSWQYWQ